MERDREFADSPLEEGVTSELVSEAKFPGNSEINRDISTIWARRRRRCPKTGIQIRALPANSLLTRTGKSLEACRELKQVIREFVDRIKEIGFQSNSG